MNARACWVHLFAVTCLCSPLLADTSVKGTPPAQSSGASNPALYAGDQIVLASTRGYASVVGRVLDSANFTGCECLSNGTCSNRPVNLMESGGFAETWVFVHGNQIPPNVAIERGTKIYRRLRSQAPYRGPIRFIIWSWPSERSTCLVTDARIKSNRTDAESFYLASFLAATANHGPVSLIGYSFGARIISAALHLTEGGTLRGYYLPNRQRPAERFRLVFIAAAVENNGLVRGGRYERALNHVDELLLLNNSKDKALRFFWIVSRSRPTALGRSGLRCAPPHVRVRQYDWANVIGTDHSVWRYLDRPSILRRVRQTVSRGNR